MGAGEVSLCMRVWPKFGDSGDEEEKRCDRAPRLVRSLEKLPTAVM